VALRPTHYRWDFRAYYFGADLAMGGADPYDLQVLGRAMADGGITDGKVMPFIYPPHALLESAPLTLVPFTAAYYLYLFAKIIALIIVVVLGSSWLDGMWRSCWPLLVALMFSSEVGGDLRSGNVGLLESALVLVAVSP
jgi:Glycosyltransferase family 87